MRKKIVLLGLWCCAAASVAHGGEIVEVDLTERMMLLVIQLGVILFAARIGHVLFERINMPGVVGEVCAGVLIGPQLLGHVRFFLFPHGLFPATGSFPVSPELYGFCAVAAIVLLFTVGLETDIRLLMRYSVAGTVVGIGGVAFSFILGDLVAMAFSRMLFGAPLGFFAPECLFLGLISTATSVGITARILSDKRKVDSPEGVTVLSGAVIDDVLGIVLLAVVLGIITASRETGVIDWGHIGLIAGKAVGVWLAATLLGLVAAKKISFLLKLFRHRSAIALMALGLALVVAGLFEETGLAMIIGAYVAGLSLSGTDVKHVVRERLRSVYDFLIPVFFCVMGMLINFKELASKEALLFGLVYTLVAMAAKVLGCGLPVMLFNFNLLGALRIGVGMLPRCEIALTIAAIGLAKGAVSHEVVGVSVLLMVLTTAIAPPVLVALFTTDAPGTRRPMKVPEGQVLTFSFPSFQMSDLVISELPRAFESDGFFVHLLNRSQQIYQARKDGSVIGFRRTGHDVIFTCDAPDVPLVNAAMFEVTAELERTIAGLREPLDVKAIARRLQDGGPAPESPLPLEQYLHPDSLQPNLKATTKAEVIDELLALLKRRNVVRDIKQVTRAIWDREKSMSTGLQHGIATPHARTDAVGRLVCAIGLKSEGLDYGSIDGEPSRIFVLTLSPESRAAPSMQFISAIAQALDEEGRTQLLACRTPAEMLAVLRRRRERT